MLKKTYNIEPKKFIPIIIFLIIAIVAYWQIAFLQNSLMHDMLDTILPWRYYVSECIQSGHFPFWNPYQQLGYPIYADLRSTWHPEVWLIGITTGYNNYTLHFLYIFYIFLAGFGMYRLILFFKTNRNVAFIIGISYMLSGYFIGHAQEMYSITSATWIPYILLFYLKMSTEKTYINAFKTSLFMFLMITSGYQGITIILNYLLLIIFIYFIIKLIKNKNKKDIFKFIKLNIVLFLSVIIFSTVIIVTLSQVWPYIQRFNGLPLKEALYFPLSPQSLVSLLIPFSVIKETEFFNTDISMTNVYMGMFLLMFLIYSLFRKKQTIEKILLYFGLFSLLASFGEYLPVRKFLYDYIPFMNLSRFPSLFRIFTIITFLIIAGIHLSKFLYEKEKNRNLLFIIITVFYLILITFIIYSSIYISFNDF